MKGTLWTFNTQYYRVLLIHTNMHTHIHTCTNAQNGKNTKFYEPWITVNYVNYVGTIRSTELNVKQLANQPAHLPRVQAPVHMNTVYVAGFRQMIHLLSAADGAVIKQINSSNYSIYNIFTVRFHDQHLYVEHIPPVAGSKYAISKFTESEEW